MDNRSRLEIYADALQRLVMINFASNSLPLYIVTEYPKSGGTWISQVLAECMGLPFPRNKRPGWESAIMHGHIKYSPFLRNVLVVFRDGRDCMVSWYFHTIFENDKNSAAVVKKTRSDLGFDDYDNVKENMPAFIEYVFNKSKRSLSPYKFTWAQFVRDWNHRACVSIKYEDMVDDAVNEMYRVLVGLGHTEIGLENIRLVVDKYSFQKQTNRSPGEENRNSFLRKGQPGDWKEKFNQEAAKVFNFYAGQELLMLGYESSNAWVDQVKA